MYTFLLGLHIFTCASLILVVLLQAGRGAGFAVFGGGGDALFASPSGSSFLKQVTVVLASTFAVTSLMLTLLGARVGMHSVTKNVAAPPTPVSPSVPGKIPAPSPVKAPAQGAQDEPRPAGGK